VARPVRGVDSESSASGDRNLSDRLQLSRDLTAASARRQSDGTMDLRSIGMDEERAAEQRWRLAAFAEDWDAPEMDVYDQYDSTVTKQKGGVE
jgi:hypothetical protein